MRQMTTIQGEVVGKNSLFYNGRIVNCWETTVDDPMAPQSLDLGKYKNMVVELNGWLYSDLWEAQNVRIIKEEGYKRITGKVVDFNAIELSNEVVHCYRTRKIENRPLNLWDYRGKIITVIGEPIDGSLYWAQVVEVPFPDIGDRDKSKKAKNLEDLLKIRAKSRAKIEAIEGNLGTALGFKWSNNQNTNHPCIIIFVPKKISSSLVPVEKCVPEILDGDNGQWCFTDVVTGLETEGSREALPELSSGNKLIQKELSRGRFGLIGGIRLAFYDDEKKKYGTGGIAVQDQSGNLSILTNRHVAGNVGDDLFHPDHNRFKIGKTSNAIRYSLFEDWYGVIDESNAVAQCDCGLVMVDRSKRSEVIPGLYLIGEVGPEMKISLNTMGIIGQKVITVGWKRGIQRGTIWGFSYEVSDSYLKVYTDMLIIGEDGTAFAEEMCSGQLIVTDDERHQPVGLLWGGRREALRAGKGQEVWIYATGFAKIKERLNINFYKKGAAPPP